MINNDVSKLLSGISNNLKRLPLVKTGNKRSGNVSIKNTFMHACINFASAIIELSKRNKTPFSIHTDNIYISPDNGLSWLPVDEEDFDVFIRKCISTMGNLYTESITHKTFKLAVIDHFKDNIHDFGKRKNTSRSIILYMQNGNFEFRSDGSYAFHSGIAPYSTLFPLSYSYDPDATCPIFFDHLNKVLPEPAIQDLLCECLAKVFLPSLKIDQIPFLSGDGANGKSVIFDVFSALVGSDNITHIPAESLTEKGSRDLHEIEGKLVNWCPDISRNLNIPNFKLIAGHEPIKAKMLYKNSRTMRKYATCIFNTNKMPLVEFTVAFFRRVLIIPFDYVIPPEERIPNFQDIIINSELPGVFNWILHGVDRLLKNRKYTESKAASDAFEAYKYSADNVAQFVKENGYSVSNPESGNIILASDLYRLYSNWAYLCGTASCGRNTFYDRLRNLGFKIEKPRNCATVVHCTHDEPASDLVEIKRVLKDLHNPAPIQLHIPLS